MQGTKFALGALALVTGLAACEKEVILPGERFDTRTPLAQSLPTEGEPSPQAPAKSTNASAPIGLPAMQSNASWTHRAANARHAAPHAALSANPKRQWSTAIGTANSRRNRAAASPVVAGGRIFAMDAAAHVTAVSTNGAVQWQTDVTAEFDLGGDVSGGGLSTDGTRVYVTTGYGEVIALTANTGAVAWRQRLDGPATGAPTVDGDAVYVVGRDGSATAMSAAAGKVLWHVAGTPSSSGMIGAASPAAGAGEVYFPFASGEIAVVSKAGGERAWGAAVAGKRNGRAYAVVGDITGDPVLVGDTLYAGSASGRTVALDATTGQRKWSAQEGALNPPLVVGGSVFVVNDESRLVRLDASTGDVIWAVQMPYFTETKDRKRKAITAHYGPILAGGRLVVVSGDGQLRLFNPVDGGLVGGAEIPGGAASGAAVAGGTLYVTGGNGQLHAFR